MPEKIYAFTKLFQQFQFLGPRLPSVAVAICEIKDSLRAFICIHFATFLTADVGFMATICNLIISNPFNKILLETKIFS